MHINHGAEEDRAITNKYNKCSTIFEENLHKSIYKVNEKNL